MPAEAFLIQGKVTQHSNRNRLQLHTMWMILTHKMWNERSQAEEPFHAAQIQLHKAEDWQNECGEISQTGGYLWGN